MTIRYCTNSTITEAWASVVGLPAPLDDTDSSVLLRAARDRIPTLLPKPAVVAVQVEPKLAVPFWREQVAWDDERHLARFGHRFLSVHFLRRGAGRYEQFEKSLQPSVDLWLELYEQALTRGADKHPVERVGFGYVNAFEFAPDNFDVSKYFKMNFGISVGAPDAGLLALDTGCMFFDEKRNMYLTVHLSVQSASEEDRKVRVITRVLAERRGIEGVSYSMRDQLGALIVEAKEAAKSTFFGFATDETHTLMGAVADASE